MRHRWSLMWCLAALLHLTPSLAQGLRLAVSSGPVSLPIYVAQAQGYFKDEGVDVTTVECASGRDCIGLLEQGRADLATAAELLVTLNHFEQADLAIFATLSSSNQIRIVANRRSGISRPQDLSGKRVGTLFGSSAEYYLDAWLLFQGIERSTVRSVSIPANRWVAALREGQIDAVAIWEPIASQVAEALADDAVAMSRPPVYTQHFTLVGKRAALAARQAELVRMLRALTSAAAFIAKYPVLAEQVLASRMGTSNAQAASFFSVQDYSLTLDQSLISTMESQARWIVRSGTTTRLSPHTLLRAIEAGPLRAALPAAVTLVK